MKKKISTELSTEARLLIAALRKVGIGESVTYQELNRAISGNVQNGNAGALRRARSVLQREDRVLFGTIIGTGLRRLSDVEVIDSGASGVRRVHRTALREAKRMQAIQRPEDLTSAQLSTLRAYTAGLRTIAMFATEKNTARLEAATQQARKELTSGETAELLRGGVDKAFK